MSWSARRRWVAPQPALSLLLLIVPGLLAARGDEPPDPAEQLRRAERAAADGRLSEAVRLYLDQAEQLPQIADWLVLRAAVLTADSTNRWTLYARLGLPAVLERVPRTEAQTRERSGDLTGAERWFATAGLPGEAARVRLLRTMGPAARAQVRRALVDEVLADPRGTNAPALLDVLLQPATVLPARDALALGRATRGSAGASRTAALLQRAVAAGIGTAADRLHLAGAQLALRRYREARATLLPIPERDPGHAEAEYLRAVCDLRLGQTTLAAERLARLLAGRVADSIAGPAAFLAGEIAWRTGDLPTARSRWQPLVTGRLVADSSERAGFLSGLALYEEGSVAEAAVLWDRVSRQGRGPERLAAGYWAGRAHQALGDTGGAAAAWRGVLARDSLSYYGLVSARRLGVAVWEPAPAADAFQRYPDLAAQVEQLHWLRALELTPELGWARAWLVAQPPGPPEHLLALANALRQDLQLPLATLFARRALTAGARPDARLYRLLYPVAWRSELERASSQAEVDPLLAAALIRQESLWEPSALSRAGAVGLMQIMPATGQTIAQKLRVAGWQPDDLRDPDVNLRFGTWYLADLLRRQDGDLIRSLAAYNAGPSRLAAWSRGEVAAMDPEFLLERIAIPETRDYVRLVQRNLWIYQALYGGGPLTRDVP